MRLSAPGERLDVNKKTGGEEEPFYDRLVGKPTCLYCCREPS